MSRYACNTETEIINQGGRVIRNSDGTISVYVLNNTTQTLQPKTLNKLCCEALGTQGIYFDTVTQKCRWAQKSNSTCTYDTPFDIVLNPKGNDGAIFTTNPDEVCTLKVEFDYLFKFSGDTLTKLANGQIKTDCNKVIDVFESLGASMIINAVVPTTNGVQLNQIYSQEFFPKIGTGNLFLYLKNNPISGFYVTCPTTNGDQQPINLYDLNVNGGLLNCSNVINQLTQDLFTESAYPQTTSGTTQFKQDISGTSFASNWKTFTTQISDQSIISGITNEKIKLNIRISGACVDFCLLVDNIRLDKSCSYVSDKTIFLDTTPGFELDRIRDNKKSWVANTSREHRTHTITNLDGVKPIRFTDYYVDNERLVINSKEIDLDISIASAIENDVWCYMVDNPCLLTGVTIGTTTCVRNASETIQTTAITTTTTQVKSVVYQPCTVYVNSSTTVSNPAVTAYTCPLGYTATPANDACKRINTQPINFNGAQVIQSGDTNNSYGNSGTYFYPQVNLSSTNLPYKYLSNGNLVDILGTVINPLAISNTAANTFWFNNGSFNGRLNKVSIKALSKTGNTISTDPNWRGFTQCLNISQSGTYYIGLAADNYCRFYVNGTLIFQTYDALGVNFNKWSVFPVQLNSGVNFISMEGLNATGDSAFGAEIYFPTGATPFNTLVNATSTASTQANVIFSSVQRKGTNWDNGQTGGYSCPAGYSINLCDPIPTCTQVLTEPITTTITPSSTTNVTVVVPSATTCPVATSITVTVTAITLTSATICVPKTYCCSEYCGDANINLEKLLTQPISSIQTIEDFEYYLTSELIDAKNRKIISSYPTLRLLYERYMNSLAYCNTNSAKFDYDSMRKFADLVGNYWTDLIEQVVPATTIWGSTRVYSNTLFDTQKFKYKNSSLFFGNNPNLDLQVLSPATGNSCNASATTEVILGSASATTLFNNQGNIKNYSNVYVIQMNSGSEFIGTVSNVKKASSTVITDCNLQIAGTVKNTFGANSSNGAITVQIYYANNPVIYSWSNGATTQNISNLSAGTYTLTITDTVNKSCKVSKSFTVIESACNLSISLSSTNPTSGNNGSITANVTGNYGNVNYSWSNGATTKTINGLSGGTYNVTATDSFGCTATATTTLYETFSIKTSSLSAISMTTLSSTTLGFIVDWGDGNTSTYNAGFNSPSHVYTSLNNQPINIKSVDLTTIKEINLIAITGNTTYPTTIETSELKKLDGLTRGYFLTKTLISGAVSELPRTLDYFITFQNSLSGLTNDLPSGMTSNLGIESNNYISGSTYGLPRNLKSVSISGQNKISGDTAGLPTGLTYTYISGLNTISGDTYGLPRNLTYMYITGNNTISGDTYGLSTGLTYLVLFGQNTISGSTYGLPRNLQNIQVIGQNQISGDTYGLPTGTTYLYVLGKNKIGGDTLGLPRTLQNLYIIGSGSTPTEVISGNISGLPTGLTECSIIGTNTISGSLSDAPANVSNIYITGNNTITGYTAGRIWTSPMNQVSIVPDSPAIKFSDSNIDSILIDLTGSTWSGGIKTITLRGTGTTVSDAAKVKLSGSTGSGNYGVTLILKS